MRAQTFLISLVLVVSTTSRLFSQFKVSVYGGLGTKTIFFDPETSRFVNSGKKGPLITKTLGATGAQGGISFSWWAFRVDGEIAHSFQSSGGSGYRIQDYSRKFDGTDASFSVELLPFLINPFNRGDDLGFNFIIPYYQRTVSISGSTTLERSNWYFPAGDEIYQVWERSRKTSFLAVGMRYTSHNILSTEGLDLEVTALAGSIKSPNQKGEAGFQLKATITLAVYESKPIANNNGKGCQY